MNNLPDLVSLTGHRTRCKFISRSNFRPLFVFTEWIKTTQRLKFEASIFTHGLLLKLRYHLSDVFVHRKTPQIQYINSEARVFTIWVKFVQFSSPFSVKVLIQLVKNQFVRNNLHCLWFGKREIYKCQYCHSLHLYQTHIMQIIRWQGTQSKVIWTI